MQEVLETTEEGVHGTIEDNLLSIAYMLSAPLIHSNEREVSEIKSAETQSEQFIRFVMEMTMFQHATPPSVLTELATVLHTETAS